MKIFVFCVIEIFLFIKIFAVTEKEVVELTKYLEENIRKTDISQMPVNNFKYRPNISETIKGKQIFKNYLSKQLFKF